MVARDLSFENHAFGFGVVFNDKSLQPWYNYYFMNWFEIKIFESKFSTVAQKYKKQKSRFDDNLFNSTFTKMKITVLFTVACCGHVTDHSVRSPICPVRSPILACAHRSALWNMLGGGVGYNLFVEWTGRDVHWVGMKVMMNHKPNHPKANPNHDSRTL